MLLCSAFIFLTAPLLPYRPYGQPVLKDLLPGLTFIEPGWWSALGGGQQGVIEGSFWTLFIEVKFYVIFGALYFLMGWRKATMILIGLFLVSSGIVIMRKFVPILDFAPIKLSSALLNLMNAEYFGWFGAGALFYRYVIERDRGLFIYGVLTAVLSALVLKGTDLGPKLPALLLCSFFAVAVASPKLQAWLSNPLLTFIGFVSYPLYLVHENLIVALTIEAGRAVPGIPDILMPSAAILVAIGIAWVVAVFGEPWARSKLKWSLGHLNNWVVAAGPAIAAATQRCRTIAFELQISFNPRQFAKRFYSFTSKFI